MNLNAPCKPPYFAEWRHLAIASFRNMNGPFAHTGFIHVASLQLQVCDELSNLRLRPTRLSGG
jgi:hypothetical protein